MQPSTQETKDAPLQLRELTRFLWRGLLFAGLVAGVTAAAAYWVSQRIPEVYSAEATIFTAQTDPDPSVFGVLSATAPLDAKAYRVAALSDQVLTRALTRLREDGASPPEDAGAEGNQVEKAALARLRERVDITTEDTLSSSFIRIEVRSASAQEAAQTANILASALVGWDAERSRRRLDQVMNVLQNQIATLNEELTTLQLQRVDPERLQTAAQLKIEQESNLSLARAIAQFDASFLEVLQSATPSPSPVYPRPVLNTVIGFIFGLIVGYLALAVHRGLTAQLPEPAAHQGASGVRRGAP